MVNRVILVGNLTRDAEASTGPATTLARLRVATNSTWRDASGNRQEAAEFHNVVAFGRLGEVCAAYCTRGRRVYVEGRLRTREYEGTDGVHRHTTEIVAETVRLLDRAPAGADAGTESADVAATDASAGEDDAASSARPAPVAAGTRSGA